MANTYTQLYVQYVFAVTSRENLIQENFREEVQKYITGIAQNNGHKMIEIYCMPDHAHIFIGLNPKQAIADCARDIKASSSKWINEKNFIRSKFRWQEGYGGFSYSRSQIPNVAHYIQNQPEHHRKRTFREEYLDFLKKFEVEYDERFLFDWLE